MVSYPLSLTKGEIVIKMFAKYGHVDSRKLEMGTKEAGAFSVMSQFISEEYDRALSMTRQI